MPISFTKYFAWSPKPKTHRLIALVVFSLSASLALGFAINSAYEIQTGKRVVGQVIRYQTVVGGRQFPVASFVNDQGESIEFNIHISPALFELGAKVNVIYFDDPNRAPKIDHVFSFWAFPAFFLMFASISLFTAWFLTLKYLRPHRRK